jgi:hypothetical protein
LFFENLNSPILAYILGFFLHISNLSLTDLSSDNVKKSHMLFDSVAKPALQETASFWWTHRRSGLRGSGFDGSGFDTVIEHR